jgi:uncharacterized membrane protein YagU involved in acid resistance
MVLNVLSNEKIKNILLFPFERAVSIPGMLSQNILNWSKPLNFPERTSEFSPTNPPIAFLTSSSCL